jgi:hypothetical protein
MNNVLYPCSKTYVPANAIENTERKIFLLCLTSREGFGNPNILQNENNLQNNTVLLGRDVI